MPHMLMSARYVRQRMLRGMRSADMLCYAAAARRQRAVIDAPCYTEGKAMPLDAGFLPRCCRLRQA